MCNKIETTLENNTKNLTQLAPKAALLYEITRNDGHLVVQDHPEKRRLGVGGHALVPRCPSTGLSNHELKSALKCTV